MEILWLFWVAFSVSFGIYSGMLQTSSPLDRPRAKVIRWIGGIGTDIAPLPSERELADHLHVSRTAVRSALRELQASGVIVVSGSGRFRRIQRRQNSPSETVPSLPGSLLQNTVVVVGAPVSRDVVPPSGWEASIQFAATRRIEAAGLHVLSLNVATATSDEMTGLAAARPKGAVLTYRAGESPIGREFAASLHARGIPVVAYGGDAIPVAHDAVVSDHAAGAEMLTRLLVARGCRRILRLWMVDEPHEWLRQRDIGHERAMIEMGVPVLPAVRLTSEAMNEVDAESFTHRVRLIAGYLAEHVLGPEPIDALMVVTDRHALWAAAALRLLGKTPNKDVLLVGYDNGLDSCIERQWEQAAPVATIDKDNPSIGQTLADLLIQRASGSLPAQAQRRVVEPRLLIYENSL